MAANAQSLIHIDVGNSILARPNLSYEYRWKNVAFGGNLRWHRNVLFGLAELPELVKTKGFNFDLNFKKYHKKYVFGEIGVRMTSIKAPEVLYGWQIVRLYNSNKRIEPFMKIGLNTNRNKRIQIDIGVGIGTMLSKKGLVIEMNQILENRFPTGSDEEILNFYKKPTGFEVNLTPHFQMRLFCLINKKQ